MPGASWISRPTPWPRPCVKCSPCPAVGDDLAGGRVDGDDVRADRQRRPAGGLRGGDQLVDLPLPVGGVPEDDGAGHVGVVAVDGRAEVELEEVAVAQHGRVGPVVRDRRVGAGGHDRLERRPPRRRAASMRASSSRPTSSSVRPGRSAPSAASSASAWSATAQARRSASISSSSLIARCASTARRTDASSGTVPPALGQHLLQGGEPVDGQRRATRSRAGRRPAAPRLGASAATVARSTSTSTSGTWAAGLRRVPAVGAEQVGPVGAHQQRAVGAGEAGQVAHVEQVGDQDGVQPALGRGRPQRVARARLALATRLGRSAQPPRPAAPLRVLTRCGDPLQREDVAAARRARRSRRRRPPDT